MISKKNESNVCLGSLRKAPDSFFLSSLMLTILIILMGKVNAAVIAGITVNDEPYYSPYPVEPGKYFDIWFRIQYSGTDGKVEGVVCGINETYPFSIDTGYDREKYIGTLSKYQEGLLKFRIRVDEDAVSGYNDLIFSCKTSTTSWSPVTFKIYVQAQDALLSVEKISTTPAELEPGKNGELQINLKNIAGVRLKDITLKLDVSSEGIPFAPINSTIEKRIKSMGINEEKNVTFDIITMPDAEPKVYKLPLKITYYDELGKSYERATLISLVVTTKPKILLVEEQTEYLKNEMKNSITVSIVNRGLSSVKFLTIFLDSSPDYTILSPQKVYVGGINSDDSETAQFDLYINTSNKKITLPFILDYSDTMGKNYVEKINLTMDVYSKEEAIAKGLEKVTPIDPLIIILVSLIGIYILYRIIKAISERKK